MDELRPSDAAPVVSDLPTLLLTGSYDPITPPVYARMAAETLRNAHVLEFRHYGHDVLGHDACANEIVESFLARPHRRPDTGCLDKDSAPKFVAPMSE